MDYILLLIGIVFLLIGGESLVRGAVAIALRFKISTLVIGMTIVSFGTSAPELLVSLKSVLSGHSDVGVGAVVGSNISNIALVLGITVLIFPIAVAKDTLRIDWPLMMVATLLFYLVIQDLKIDFIEGIVFVAILLTFSIWLIFNSRKKGKELYEAKDVEEYTAETHIFKDVMYLVFGFIALYFGSEWLITGVVNIANKYGISEKFISITVVAFGTSIPELVTSAVAAYRKETDISIGNLIGSNIFNILAILGITAVVKPIDVAQSIIDFDVYFLLAISIIIFPLMYLGRKVTRSKGVLLVLFYIFYIYLTIIREF